jgi:hypothetical protein
MQTARHDPTHVPHTTAASRKERSSRLTTVSRSLMANVRARRSQGFGSPRGEHRGRGHCARIHRARPTDGRCGLADHRRLLGSARLPLGIRRAACAPARSNLGHARRDSGGEALPRAVGRCPCRRRARAEHLTSAVPGDRPDFGRRATRGPPCMRQGLRDVAAAIRSQVSRRPKDSLLNPQPWTNRYAAAPSGLQQVRGLEGGR